ncbi:MAG: SagB/ThcOx family dehydrogenase [Herbinix sp.]|nr:SagB/ThcOx family dehydrogenase [Herbinix sp.]
MEKNMKREMLDINEKYFWSPAITWKINNDNLEIAVFEYSGIAIEYFPKFYYITQDGITIDKLLESFSNYDSNLMLGFVKDLIKNRILVHGILAPHELFYTQDRLFESPYNEDILYNPEKYDAYKHDQMTRSFKNCKNDKISLNVDYEFPASITERITHREFDEGRKVPFETFCKLISVFRQKNVAGHPRYNYASAGGLYPIDIFLYIKDNRVEGVKAGLYYYNPLDNSIELVSDTCVISEEAHFHTNKKIYNSSAFSLFAIYDAQVTMPKYSGMGYLYAFIDTGIMVELLTQVAELNNIGLCSIGDMNFKRIEKYFKLYKSHIFLHDIEIGLKK